VSETINETIPFVKPKNSSFPHCFSKSLIYYIKNKYNFFKKYKKSKSDYYYYSIFSYYRKLVKITIKVDRFDWLKIIDNNFRTQPKHFWKYICKFKRNDQSVIQIEIGNKISTEPQRIADVSADHFPSNFNSSSSVHAPNNSECVSSDFLNIPHISDSDVQRAISRLSSTKCVGPDEIPNFIIKGCSEIFTPFLCHIFNLSLFTGKFPSLWKKAAVVPIFKKGNRVLVGNYRPMSILNNFSKFFESIIHDHLSFYFKFTLHSNQHGFVKSKSTVTNFVLKLFYRLYVHRDSLTLFILILSRPSIKFLVLFYWTSSTISDFLHFTLIGSRVTYQINLPSFVI
jgi:hypothetical protein